jgi:DNA-binding IclR family transcriptional regulator
VRDRDDAVTVRELFDELRQERAIAYTTVMSTRDNLHRKGWLDRVKGGKAYRLGTALVFLVRAAVRSGPGFAADVCHSVAGQACTPHGAKTSGP